MGVSEEILMFLFRRERVKHLKIGDVQGEVDSTWCCVVELGVGRQIFTLSLTPGEEGSKMGRAKGKLRKNQNGRKFVRDRVLRGKIVCNRSSGLIQYESDGRGSWLGIDRCYVAMKKLENWRKYSLSEWRESENVTVETDMDGEEISSDSEEI
jgi:hypothetical protein